MRGTEPVDAPARVAAEAEEGAEEQEQAVTREPDVAATSLQQEPHECGGLQRGCCPPFDEGGLMAERAESRDDGDEQQPASPTERTGPRMFWGGASDGGSSRRKTVPSPGLLSSSTSPSDCRTNP